VSSGRHAQAHGVSAHVAVDLVHRLPNAHSGSVMNDPIGPFESAIDELGVTDVAVSG
jgi:hypothetical protein